MKATTRDERDERLTSETHYASDAAAKDIVQKPRAPKAKPPKTPNGAKTWRIRLTVTTTDTEAGIRDALTHVTKSWNGRITRVREVLE